jgi:hypothetical protein
MTASSGRQRAETHSPDAKPNHDQQQQRLLLPPSHVAAEEAAAEVAAAAGGDGGSMGGSPGLQGSAPITGTGTLTCTQEETAAAAGTSGAAAPAAAAAKQEPRAGKRKAAAAAAAEPAMGAAAGCLAEENLQGREVVDVALAAVRQQLAVLQAGRPQGGVLDASEVERVDGDGWRFGRLEQDLHRCALQHGSSLKCFSYHLFVCSKRGIKG